MIDKLPIEGGEPMRSEVHFAAEFIDELRKAVPMTDEQLAQILEKLRTRFVMGEPSDARVHESGLHSICINDILDEVLGGTPEPHGDER